MSCTGAVESDARRRRGGHPRGGGVSRLTERGATRADDRAVRGRHGGPQASRATSDDRHPSGSRDPRPTSSPGTPLPATTSCAWPRPAPSTTASPRWSAGCSTTPSRSSPTSSTPSSGSAATAASTAADLALLTDGLRAEREQGITIDVAYRYFSTATRSFVLADTPGHVQYTRNMVTGASTAELALILVDARHGVVEQTRRHLAVTGPARRAARRARGQQDGPRRLGRGEVRRDRGRVRPSGRPFRHRRRRSPFPSRLCWATTSSTAPPAPPGMPGPRSSSTSRRCRSAPTPPWSRCACRCSTSSGRARPSTPTTAGMPAGWPPVWCVLGTRSWCCPSGRRTTVAGIDRAGATGEIESLDVAFAPQSVVLRLADDIDISRGDLIAAGRVTGAAHAGSDGHGRRARRAGAALP